MLAQARGDDELLFDLQEKIESSFIIEAAGVNEMSYIPFYGGSWVEDGKIIILTTDKQAEELQRYKSNHAVEIRKCLYSLNELSETLVKIAVTIMPLAANDIRVNSEEEALFFSFSLDIMANRVHASSINIDLEKALTHFRDNRIELAHLYLTNTVPARTTQETLLYQKRDMLEGDSTILKKGEQFNINKIIDSLAMGGTESRNGLVRLKYLNIHPSEDMFQYQKFGAHAIARRTSNIRSGPSIYGRIVDIAPKGTFFDVILIDSDWVQVSWNNGNDRAYTHINNIFIEAN